MGSRRPPLVPGEHLTFVGMRLEPSDEALKRIDRTKLSASVMQAMAPKSCHARYAADQVLPREDDPFAANTIGTDSHAVLEDLMALPATERTQERAKELLIASGQKAWPDQEDGSYHPLRARWQREVWQKVEGLWQIEDPTEVDVFATELKADDIKIAGIPFIGYIDRTDRLPNGNLRVLDYKSGKGKGVDGPASLRKLARFGDQHGDQVRLYDMAVQEMYGEKVDSGALYYIGEGKAREITLDKANAARVRTEFVQSYDELKGSVAAGVFETKPGPLCGWCPLVNICPAAALDGRTAKIDAPTTEELGIPVVNTQPVATHQGLDTDPAFPEDPMADYDPAGDFVEPDALPDFEPFDPLAEDETEPEPTPKARRAAGRARQSEPADIAAARPERLFGEEKPWEATAGDRLNGNSYAVTGTFGLVDLAYEALVAHRGQVRPSQIKALTQTFAKVVADAQLELAGTRNPIDGINTRLRGALRTSLVDSPAPLGATSGEWESWMVKTTRRVIAIGRIVHETLTEDTPAAPYLALAHDEVDDLAA